MEMTKTEQIRAGLQKSFQSRTSVKASTICYGHKTTQSSGLVVDSAKANTVLFIFHHFINGDSPGKISDTLAYMGITSPTGRDTWSRETISKLPANEWLGAEIVATVREFHPRKKKLPLKKVAAYCRVSTKVQDQLDSLTAQE